LCQDIVEFLNYCFGEGLQEISKLYRIVFMKRYISLLIWVLATLSMAACAQLDTKQSNGKILAQVDDIITGSMQTRPAVVQSQGKPAILYATKADRIAVQLGGESKVIDESARVKGYGRFLQLQSDGDELRALWWSHLDGKNGYFTSTVGGGLNFAPVNVINDEHGILAPMSLLNGPQGELVVSYLDERLSGYQVYSNRSLDNGRTWANPDQRLDAPISGRTSTVYEPQTVKAGAALVVVWADVVPSDGKNKYRILSRRSADGGATWTGEDEIYAASHQPTSLKVRSLGDSVVVAADEVSHGIFALVSTDAGRTWKNAGFLEGTGAYTNSGVDMALADGRAHLVWMQERADQKLRVIAGSLAIPELAWIGSAKRLDLKTYDNTKAWLPVVLATSQGVIVSAWVDYRDIRPNIYLSASYDKGQTWTTPQALLKPGEVSAGWPQLITWGPQAAIGYELYPTDRPAEGKFMVQEIDTAGSNQTGILALGAIPVVNEAERKARLEQRIQELWAYRVAGNYEKAYDYFDFAYRAATSKKVYTDNTGVINYLDFSVDTVSVVGNEASVNMKLKYEVKPMIVPFTAKPLEVKPIDVESPSKWVWVGTDWYLVYSPSFDPPVLKY